MTTEQTRRSIAERVMARALARGTPIDDDPEYMTIVEVWIAGEISVQEMRQRYVALLQERSRVFRAQAEYSPSTTTTEDEQAEERPAVDEVNNPSHRREISEGDPAEGGVVGA
ncbi:hypothetical protein J2046_002616 [Rhizobium petrolearium]|uniref:hypothetical protein n=1 Tax=Neorhizobium petrolearium TaxID=515361 RepID=UPI001AE2A842|nr:hypothetical protein [Neorhizobium petrolearium]MBP1844357.1 hypothetical protein [Neorhizobium petrolearium]